MEIIGRLWVAQTFWQVSRQNYLFIIANLYRKSGAIKGMWHSFLLLARWEHMPDEQYCYEKENFGSSIQTVRRWLSWLMKVRSQHCSSGLCLSGDWIRKMIRSNIQMNKILSELLILMNPFSHINIRHEQRNMHSIIALVRQTGRVNDSKSECIIHDYHTIENTMKWCEASPTEGILHADELLNFKSFWNMNYSSDAEKISLIALELPLPLLQFPYRTIISKNEKTHRRSEIFWLKIKLK